MDQKRQAFLDQWRILWSDPKRFWYDSWDANGIRGHLILQAVGALASLSLGWYFKIPTGGAAALGASAIVLNLLVIPPFVLPVRAMDAKEKTYLFILTFAPSAGLGVVLGLIGLNPIGLIFYAICVAVAISFWSIGQMSRNFYFAAMQQVGLFARYPLFADLCALAKIKLLHIDVDGLIKAITPESYEDGALETRITELASKFGPGWEARVPAVMVEMRKLLAIPDETPPAPPVPDQTTLLIEAVNGLTQALRENNARVAHGEALRLRRLHRHMLYSSQSE